LHFQEREKEREKENGEVYVNAHGDAIDSDRDADARLSAVLHTLLSLWGDLTFAHRSILWLNDDQILIVKTLFCI
jgi:hypothetical protein